MTQSRTLKETLRKTIGSATAYHGTPCIVVELLEEPLCLVLQALGPRTALQESQFGTPQRHVSTIFAIPCLSDEGADHWHPELLALGLALD